MWLMLQQPTADDYVIATGQIHSLEAFVEEVFRLHGLDWREYVEISSEFLRPTDILVGCANLGRARERLGWVAKSDA